MDFPAEPPAITRSMPDQAFTSAQPGIRGRQHDLARSDRARPPVPGLKLIFNEDFQHIKLFPAPGGWLTTFFWGGRTLPTNKEQQLFVDPGLRGKSGAELGLNPFHTRDGILTITADRTPESLRPEIGGFAYTSGLLSTFKSFAFTYGYVEVRAQFPKGKGLLPAIWMLRKDAGRLGEIDIVEVLGDRPDFMNSTVHTRLSMEQKAPDTTKLARRLVPDLSGGFHRYGLEWTAQTITVFFDGQEMGRMDTPAALHSPMYLLIGLAVGGVWPGSPDATTKFPAEFQIDYLRVWQKQTR